MLSKNRIKFIRSLAIKKFRDEEGVFVAEGHKTVDELSQQFEVVEKYEGEEASKVSLLDTPQDVVAVLKKQTYHLPDINFSSTLILALDSIQNPGNLGTIVRLADWFGIEDIICSKDCADIYNPKTVQATMGSMARVRVHYTDLAEWLHSLPQNIPVYGTFLEGEDIQKAELTKNGVIIMGNEGHGISTEIQKFVTHRIFIPPYPQGRDTAESLNVAMATGITLFSFRR